jgi:hypothetical protein
VAAVASRVNRKVVAPLSAMLQRADLPFRLRDVDPSSIFGTRPGSPDAAVPAASVTLSLSLLGGARTPTPAQLQAVALRRLSPFLTVLFATPRGRTVMVLKRAAGASRQERAATFLALSWSRPRAEVVSELASTFGMALTEAAALHAMYALSEDGPGQGALWHRRVTQRSDQNVIELVPTGSMGYDVTLHNVTRTAYVDRIVRLLVLLVAEAPAGADGPALRLLPPRPPDDVPEQPHSAPGDAEQPGAAGFQFEAAGDDDEVLSSMLEQEIAATMAAARSWCGATASCGAAFRCSRASHSWHAPSRRSTTRRSAPWQRSSPRSGRTCPHQTS